LKFSPKHGCGQLIGVLYMTLNAYLSTDITYYL